MALAEMVLVEIVEEIIAAVAVVKRRKRKMIAAVALEEETAIVDVDVDVGNMSCFINLVDSAF